MTGECAVLVQMELARIIISEINDQQVVFLREVDTPPGRDPRSFPILIGIFEATSIDRRVQGNVPQRPLTHDLLKNVIDQLGGEVQDIVITNLVDHTYYAQIRIRKEGELIEVDSRPSDALALSVHYEPHLPIYVDDEVLGEVT
jgi:bifunctional DNase/RNase